MLVVMPFPEFDTCAHTLETEELWWQVADIELLLRTLLENLPGWRDHSMATMWRGHEEALAVYELYVMAELQARGYRMSTQEALKVRRLVPSAGDWSPEMPDWVGCNDIHVSHRAFLIHKNPAYAEKFPNLEPSVRLAWPE